MIKRILLFLLTSVFFSGCATTEQSSTTLSEKAEAFFDVYAKRENIDSLLAFYADDIVLHDMVYGDEIIGKAAVEGFLRWQDPAVELNYEKSLVVTEQVIDGNHVVTRGYFLPFKYHGQALGPWHFVIWHTFDDQGKIIEQTDWINYTPKAQFVDGMDLNQNIRVEKP